MADEVLGLFNRKPDQGSSGMEDVVATVSGYLGAERFNLIKLINHTGASYVGNMSKAITHLVDFIDIFRVCWKFEGSKYNLAKKLKTKIVSHQWFEECAKAGRRVPEGPYSKNCGHEVGPVEVDGLLIGSKDMPIRKGSGVLSDITNSREHSRELAIDLKDEETGKTKPSRSCLLEQDVNPVTYLKSKTPRVKKNKSKTRPLCSSNRSEEPYLSALIGNMGEESSSTHSEHSRRRKRDTCHDTINEVSADNRSKVRRLVKRSIPKCVLESEISNSEEDSFVVGASMQQGAFSTSNHSDEETEETIGLEANRSPQNFKLPNSGAAAADMINCKDSSHGDAKNTKPNDQSGIKSELSCVICWTDFSLTRGVLECGHRFCYTCIQLWSDQMSSKGKVSTCPLCKEEFVYIRKVDDAAASDQKVYSQTIPCGPVTYNAFVLPSHENFRNRTQFPTEQACTVCHSREPEDLLEKCRVCQTRCIHVYCLDPPLFPWLCVHCRDLRNVYAMH